MKHGLGTPPVASATRGPMSFARSGDADQRKPRPSARRAYEDRRRRHRERTIATWLRTLEQTA
jgi:hypothetical protein